ncbi:uncharacterized protein JCM6883_006576 [Sporobolomyces salmoneus]|uniref:uncharacterized protein n=1 Tax=Sporobolomyces salmoneus TaxID=183962 RepID=UPI00316AFE70
MPPKPKGLKASKRAAPFDPSSVSEEPTPSTSTDSTERTYPLDEDSLTLSDLFELRLTVLDLLYPFPTDLFISQTDPEKLDEARSFLRGILHGCAVLEQYVPQSGYGDVAEKDQEGNRSDEKVEQRRKEAGEEKLKALGLDDRDITEGLVLYLQGWSLHQLGEIFEDPKEEIKSAALKLGGGGGAGPSKKRKLDLNEPRTKIEWLEAAHAKYRLAHDGVSRCYRADGDDDHLLMSLTSADFVRCETSLARSYFESGEQEKGKEIMKEETHEALFLRAGDDTWAIGYPEHECLECGDAILAQIRVWAETVSFIEQYPRDEREGWEHKFDDSEAGDKDLRELDRARYVLESDAINGELARFEKDAEGKLKEHCALWKWLMSVVIADAKMAYFIKLEDAIEAKYRPEDEDAEEEEEDDEESEVKELPMDAKDVKLVKAASEEAIDAISQTIASFASLPASVAHPAGRDSQYRKLEEALLISSALVNPSDKEGTAKIEEEIEKVRKEGGLNEEETEGEGKAESEKK